MKELETSALQVEISQSVPDRLPWYAIRTKSKFEKAVSVNLRAKGYEEFLPCYRSRRAWSDRTKIVELPLFAGYLFCRLDINHRLPILQTPGVAYLVSADKGPVTIPDHEIEAIQKIVRHGAGTAPWPYIKEGQKVAISEGPMKDLTGILLRIKNDFRLVVSVTMLQRSVAVEIDRDIIRPLA